MDSFIKQIDQFIEKHNLLPVGSKVIIGLSGGPDSLFLLHFLAEKHRIGTITLVAAHLDHEWRANSANDALFCQETAAKLGVLFVSAKISDLSLKAKYGGSREAYARTMRRHFLQQVKTEHHADIIALAHHTQDQQETFFIRLIRGATLTGLTAMRPKSGNYIRPLLETDKQDILHYLHEHSIPYLTDPSNNSEDFLRNRIRQKIIPALKACDERFEKNLKIGIKRLQEEELLLNKLTQEAFDKISIGNDGICVYLEDLFKLDKALQYRVIMHWLQYQKVPFTPTQKFLDEILRFLQQPGSKQHKLHHAWLITKKKNNAKIEYV
ncbi:MAG: tRNA lysidine(34) synthetase TilS [bacterium]|nr:tRNA lysidine(34) synthetase TilS [bacterium]